MSVVKSASTVGALVFLSRITGYARDIQVAGALGAGPLADAFFVAYRIPNLIRQISAEGAFQNAFIPLYSAALATGGEEDARRFGAVALGWMLALLFPTCVAAHIFMPEIVALLAWGFRGDSERMGAAVFLGRVIFPYVAFVSVVCLYGGMLNGRGKFFPFVSSSIWLNVGMVAGAIWLKPFFATAAEALAWSILIGGVAQTAWIVYFAVKHKAFVWPAAPRRRADVKSLGRRMVPGILGGGITQINLWANTIIATFFAGMASTVYYADRLLQFPLAMIGTAMGIALLPALSRHVAAAHTEKSYDLQRKAMELAMGLSLPAAVGAAALAPLLVKALFERGEFTPDDTERVAHILRIFMAGLPAFVLNRILGPVFYASGDTASPAWISLATLVVNVALTLSAVPFMGESALAFGPAAAAWANGLAYAVILRKRKLSPADFRMGSWLPAQIGATLCMAGALYAAEKFSFGNAGIDAAARISVGALAYGFACMVAPRYRPRKLWEMVRR
ncbi:MAG: murein biosynthesis integral membrane protein MurJ [Rickettsiales bacterium]